MKVGETIQLRDANGKMVKFSITDYRINWDAFAVKPLEPWEGTVPTMVAPTMDGHDYWVVTYADT